ncbi:MAG: hypothetical protein EOO10_08565 [Chitinophagaceae bacterium]|nr:MAG: hypothetical protein EOO10_08565 [Chitinophagaceae bacterium]
MAEERIEDYIHKRLAELDEQRDMRELTLKGKLSFGVDATSYGQLPAWNDLVKRKKLMVKMVWLDAFFVSLMIVFVVADFSEKFAQNWLKAIVGLILLSAVVMLLYVVGAFYSLFYHFRQTEREVRKLIYQDILSQLKKEEKETV